MAAPPQGLLLDALADQVELGPGQRDVAERVHHRDRIRDRLGCCGFVAVNPSMAMTCTPATKSAGWAANKVASAAAERPATRSSNRARPL
jgi:hypothetical protein